MQTTYGNVTLDQLEEVYNKYGYAQVCDADAQMVYSIKERDIECKK